VLETIQIGGQRMTSKEALARFFTELTERRLKRRETIPVEA
jgi:hypothetical protein